MSPGKDGPWTACLRRACAASPRIRSLHQETVIAHVDTSMMLPLTRRNRMF